MIILSHELNWKKVISLTFNYMIFNIATIHMPQSLKSHCGHIMLYVREKPIYELRKICIGSKYNELTVTSND